MHFYDYSDDSFQPVSYPIPRFASGYGFQSLPSAESFLTDTSTKSDLGLKSDFMNYRQHHPQGNTQLMNLIAQQFTLPNVSSPNYDLAIIYYSQVSIRKFRTNFDVAVSGNKVIETKGSCFSAVEVSIFNISSSGV